MGWSSSVRSHGARPRGSKGERRSGKKQQTVGERGRGADGPPAAVPGRGCSERRPRRGGSRTARARPAGGSGAGLGAGGQSRVPPGGERAAGRGKPSGSRCAGLEGKGAAAGRPGPARPPGRPGGAGRSRAGPDGRGAGGERGRPRGEPRRRSAPRPDRHVSSGRDLSKPGERLLIYYPKHTHPRPPPLLPSPPSLPPSPRPRRPPFPERSAGRRAQTSPGAGLPRGRGRLRGCGTSPSRAPPTPLALGPAPGLSSGRWVPLAPLPGARRRRGAGDGLRRLRAASGGAGAGGAPRGPGEAPAGGHGWERRGGGQQTRGIGRGAAVQKELRKIEGKIKEPGKRLFKLHV